MKFFYIFDHVWQFYFFDAVALWATYALEIVSIKTTLLPTLAPGLRSDPPGSVAGENRMGLGNDFTSARVQVMATGSSKYAGPLASSLARPPASPWSGGGEASERASERTARPLVRLSACPLARSSARADQCHFLSFSFIFFHFRSLDPPEGQMLPT